MKHQHVWADELRPGMIVSFGSGRTQAVESIEPEENGYLWIKYVGNPCAARVYIESSFRIQVKR